MSEVILNEHGPENIYEVDLNETLQRAMKYIEIIEQGSKFKGLLAKAQFNMLLQSGDK